MSRIAVSNSVLLTPNCESVDLVLMTPKRRFRLAELPSVTSARAAEIVGIGYEGFRSYLKRGLLGRVGMLPGFHAANSNTFDAPTPRTGWKRFGFADLCLMRAAKLLIDAGYSFTDANDVVSDDKLWQRLACDVEPVDRYFFIWPPFKDYMLFDADHVRDLPRKLKEAKALNVAVTLINLGDVERYVAERLAAAAASSEA